MNATELCRYLAIFVSLVAAIESVAFETIPGNARKMQKSLTAKMGKGKRSFYPILSSDELKDEVAIFRNPSRLMKSMAPEQPEQPSLMCPLSDEPILLLKSDTLIEAEKMQEPAVDKGLLIFDGKQTPEEPAKDGSTFPVAVPAATALLQSTSMPSPPLVPLDLLTDFAHASVNAQQPLNQPSKPNSFSSIQFNINGGKICGSSFNALPPGTVLFEPKDRQSQTPIASSSEPLPIFVNSRNTYQSSSDEEEEASEEIDYFDGFVSDLNEADIASMPFESGYMGPQIGPKSLINLEYVKYALIPYFQAGHLLDRKSVMSILLRAYNIMSKESSLQEINIADDETLMIFGDVHGQFPDFIKVLQAEGFPSNTLKILFNGDIVDRGAYSMESLLTLLALKIAEPKNVFITLGNHETTTVGRLQFYREILSKYESDEIFHLAHQAFRSFPVAFLIQNEIFVSHGGVTPDLTLNAVRGVNRLDPDSHDEYIINNLIWSDPVDKEGLSPSHRGLGYLFGPNVTSDFLARNNLSLIIRSHQYKEIGYAEHHDGQLVTIFSCPNYRGKMNNIGAYIKLTADLTMTFKHFLEADSDPSDSPSLPEERRRKILRRGNRESGIRK